MKPLRQHIPQWVLIGLLILLGITSLFLLWQLSSTTNLGSGDFVGYWSATHLLSRGESPYDPALVGDVQHNQIRTGSDLTIMAWNPPMLFVFLLPLAWLPFMTAKFIWLVIIIGIVLGTSLMLAQLYLPQYGVKAQLCCLLFAISLPQVISGIFMGQVTFLVFLGLVASLVLIKKEQWFWAGAVLILTAIKPHLVILSLIYLLLYMAQRRRYMGWAGLIVAGLFCVVVLFLFRPEWIQDLIGEMKISPVNWFTPTVGGLFSYLGITESLRYMIVLFLPLPFLLIKYGRDIKLEVAVAILTLLTIPVTFFGWSYDQVILLIPIAQIFGWLSAAKNKASIVGFGLVIGLGLVGNFVHHVFNRNDVFFLWFPFFLWFLFGLTWLYVVKTAPVQTELSAEKLAR